MMRSASAAFGHSARHQPVAATARKIPRKLVGRVLTADEAAALLDRLS